MRLVNSIAMMVAALAPVWGQACTNETTRGAYGFVCSGFISPGPNLAEVPFTALGTVVGNAAGVFTGGGKASVGGTTIDWSVVGTGQTHSDCTGSITYEQKFNGQPAGSINIDYQVLDGGKEIRGMPVDPGTNILCNLRW